MSHYKMSLSTRQKQALDLLNSNEVKELLYGGAKGGGKSVLGCYWVFFTACDIINKFELPVRKYPITIGFIGRKRSVDFTDTTLETWKKFIPEQAYSLRTSEKEIIINERVKIAYGGFDSEMDIKKFNSAEYAFYFIDQAEEVSRDDIALLKGTLRLKIGDTPLDYKGLMTANPADCWLKDRFITQLSKGCAYLPALPSDNPYLPPGYINTLIEAFAHRPELVEAYVHGSWDVLSDANIVIKTAWVNDAINRFLPNFLDNTVVSCDPARFGDDETVIYVIKGGQVIDSMCYGQKSTMETAGNCASMRNKHNAELILVDGVGVGAGVVDKLMELNEPVKEVNFANKPSNEMKQEKYYNLRAEVYWEAAEMFSNQQVSMPNDMVLRQQLSHIQYSNASKGRIKIESKDDIKKRLGGGSPDRGDALVIGLWGLSLLPKKYNDYDRMKQGQQRAIDSGRFTSMSPVYEESLRMIGANNNYQKSDYEL